MADGAINSLEDFASETLTIIMKKVGKESAVDYCNARVTCKKMKTVSNTNMVLSTLCLSPLVKKPLRAPFHIQLLNRCINNGNSGAYFIHGLLNYFVANAYEEGMASLALAAMDEGADLILEAAYLCGVLKLLHGNFDDGKEQMAKLHWENDEDLKTTNDVWKNLRKMLHGITVTKMAVYRHNLGNMLPPESCHLGDLEITCEHCFHYKRAKKFYHMMP